MLLHFESLSIVLQRKAEISKKDFSQPANLKAVIIIEYELFMKVILICNI